MKLIRQLKKKQKKTKTTKKKTPFLVPQPLLGIGLFLCPLHRNFLEILFISIVSNSCLSLCSWSAAIRLPTSPLVQTPSYQGQQPPCCQIQRLKLVPFHLTHQRPDTALTLSSPSQETSLSRASSCLCLSFPPTTGHRRAQSSGPLSPPLLFPQRQQNDTSSQY